MLDLYRVACKVLFHPVNQMVAQAVGQRMTRNQQATAHAITKAIVHG
jgi:hypothetical protein